MTADPTDEELAAKRAAYLALPVRKRRTREELVREISLRALQRTLEKKLLESRPNQRKPYMGQLDEAIARAKRAI